MGRIKTQLVKRITRELMQVYRNKFTDDFEKNKILVERFVVTSSKKLRNIIAGYVTRLVKKGKEDSYVMPYYKIEENLNK